MFIRILYGMILICVISNAQANGEEVQKENNESKGLWEVGFIIGASNLTVDPEFTFSREKENRDTFSVGARINYIWDDKFVIETSYVTSIDLDLFGISDAYDLEQYNIQLGYKVPITDRLKMIPKIGISNWELDSNEGAFFNPGVEESYTYHGTDPNFSLLFEFQVWEEISITLGYETTKYDFGRIEVVDWGFTFEF